MLVCICFNTCFRWVNIYVCGCFFEVVIQIKQKKLNQNEIPLFVANNLAEKNPLFAFIKKGYNLLSKKIALIKKKCYVANEILW